MNDPNNDISAEILAGPMHYQKEIQNSEVPASMKFINHESSATSSQKQQAIVIVGSVNADVYLEIGTEFILRGCIHEEYTNIGSDPKVESVRLAKSIQSY